MVETAAARREIRRHHQGGRPDLRPYQRRIGGEAPPRDDSLGAAFLDHDGDGDQDLLLVNSTHWPDRKSASEPTQALYRNDGQGRFEDVTKAAGLAKTLFGMGVAVGDYDSDGDPDVYLTTLTGGVLPATTAGPSAT